MMNRMKIFNSLLGVFVILGVSIYAATIYSTYFEKPFLSYKNLPFPITPFAFPGDTVEATVIRCSSSHETKQLISSRALVPEDPSMQTIILEFILVNVTPGCTSPMLLKSLIPLSTPPGLYRYVGKSKIKGLISEHDIDWNTDLVLVSDRPQLK